MCNEIAEKNSKKEFEQESKINIDKQTETEAVQENIEDKNIGEENIKNESIKNESRKKQFKKAFWAAAPHTLPILAGFSTLGIAYGFLMQTKGYGAFWSVLMSAVCFCGSMQYVAITLLTTVFNPIQAFFLSLMVNARHLFYGISLLKKYRGMGKFRFLLIFWLCDETYSLVTAHEVPSGINRKYFYGIISALDYMYWVIATLIGSVLGSFITFDTTGLDFVLTGLFVVLFLEQILNKKKTAFGVIGLLCSVVMLIVFGADNMVIASMIAILSALLIGRKKLCI